MSNTELTRPLEIDGKTTLKRGELRFYRHVIMLKGAITKPLKREVNIVTTVNLTPSAKAPRSQPLITSLQKASTVKECWFADDAGGEGSATEIKR